MQVCDLLKPGILRSCEHECVCVCVCDGIGTQEVVSGTLGLCPAPRGWAGLTCLEALGICVKLSRVVAQAEPVLPYHYPGPERPGHSPW